MRPYKPGDWLGTEETKGSPYVNCKICDKDFRDRSDLIEHLRSEHETLELASYAAATMAAEQERDRIAAEFRRRFDLLRKELAGHEAER